MCVLGGAFLDTRVPPPPSSPSFSTTSSTCPSELHPGRAQPSRIHTVTHASSSPDTTSCFSELVFVSKTGVGWGQDTNRLTNEAGSPPASSPPPCRRLPCPSPSKSPPSSSPPRTRPRAPRAAPCRPPTRGSRAAFLRERGAPTDLGWAAETEGAAGRAREAGTEVGGGREARREGGREGGGRASWSRQAAGARASRVGSAVSMAVPGSARGKTTPALSPRGPLPAAPPPVPSRLLSPLAGPSSPATCCHCPGEHGGWREGGAA